MKTARKAPQSKAKTGKIIGQAKTVGGKCGLGASRWSLGALRSAKSPKTMGNGKMLKGSWMSLKARIRAILFLSWPQAGVLKKALFYECELLHCSPCCFAPKSRLQKQNKRVERVVWSKLIIFLIYI